jgi:exopolysaccharide biosynthesis polyprenyl glycosylphosphotransferase
LKSFRYTSVRLLAYDTVALFVAFNLTGWLRGIVQLDSIVLLPLFVPFLLMVTAFYLIDGYKARTDMLGTDYTSQHLLALVAAMLCSLLITFVLIPSGYSLQQSRAVVALSFVLLMPVTLVYRRSHYLRRLRFRGDRTLIFVGDRTSCDEFKEECVRMKFSQPVLFADFASSTASPFSATEIATFESVLAKIDRQEITPEAIVIRESSRELPPEISQHLIRLYFDGVSTYTLELFHQVYWRKIPLYRLNQSWLFQDGFQIAREPLFERAKRISDIAMAAVGLILSFPLMLLAGFAIWFEDRGPVLFTQNRIGRNRTTFRIVKLRTMRVQQAPGSRYTLPNDHRVTRVGRFLRITRLDEVPQLWNVLRGEMSLIGPRAEWDLLVTDYERQLPSYHYRHLVKPGITGWAQVNYPYGANLEDTIRKLEYDLYYIRHFSFMLDAAIMLKTVHTIIFGRGSR